MKITTFLTVLCILTFVGSTFGILGGIYGYFTAKATTSMVTQSRETMDSLIKDANIDSADIKPLKLVTNLSNTMSKGYTVEKIRNNSLFQILASIFCLGGALLMWKLKKSGYYSYLIGTLIGIIGPLAIFGIDNFLGIASSLGVALVGIVFCILYGLNYKHLKN